MRFILIALCLSACGEQDMLDQGTFHVNAARWDLICADPTDISDLYSNPEWKITHADEWSPYYLTIGALQLIGEETENSVDFKADWDFYHPERLDSHTVIHTSMDGDKLIARMQVWQTKQQNTPEPVPACVNMWDITGTKEN